MEEIFLTTSKLSFDLIYLPLNYLNPCLGKLKTQSKHNNTRLLYSIHKAPTVCAVLYNPRFIPKNWLQQGPTHWYSTDQKYKWLCLSLLTGDSAVTGRTHESSDKILDSYMTLAINSPLLSQQQRQELNPLIICILSATSLPMTPTPISVLQVMFILLENVII